MEIRTIHQKNLTSECWLIQMEGVKACDSCEVKDTEECGGKRIRETLKNSKNLEVPIS